MTPPGRSKRSPLYVSCFLAIGCVLGACAAEKTPRPSHFREDVLAGSALIHRFGVLSTPGVVSYPPLVISRLTRALPERHSPAFSVLVLESDQIIALSLGNGRIVLSRGVAKALQSESELAFVLAHEMAHHLLGHQDLIEQDEYSAPPGREALEAAADRMALEIIARAGYDTRAGFFALHNTLQACRANGDLRPETEHQIESRSRALMKVIPDQLLVFATIDSREFRRFQQALS